MKTKYDHTFSLTPTDCSPLFEFFYSYAQLKYLYRQGWLIRGVSEDHCESDADHSFGVAMLSYILATELRPDLDAAKAMQLGLFHEVGEILVGDITPHDGVSKVEKMAREAAAVDEVFSNLPHGSLYASFWREYVECKTPEAQFVNRVDKIETVLQASLYERQGNGQLQEFFDHYTDMLNNTEMQPLLDEILELR